MIPADTVQTLTTFTPHALARALHDMGYSGVSFKDAKFDGITVHGDFRYHVTYYNDARLGEEQGYIFLTYDHESGKVTVDY